MMDSLLNQFNSLKISVFEKCKKLQNNPSFIYEIEDVLPPEIMKIQVQNRNGNSPKEEREDHSRIPTFFKRDILEESKTVSNKSPPALEKFKMYVEFTEKQGVQDKEQWSMQKQENLTKTKKQQENMLQQMEAATHGKSYKKDEELIQHFQRKAKLEQKIEENKEKKRLLQEKIETIKYCQVEFRSVYQEILKILPGHVGTIQKELGDYYNLLKQLPKYVEDVVEKAKKGQINDEEIKRIKKAVNQIKALHIKIDEIIKKKLEEEKALQSKVTSSNQFIHQINSQHYERILDFQMKHSESFKGLLEDNKLKKFRADCEKAVNIPVNLISAVNIQHLKDKYNKLHDLLSGKNVTIGEKTINASSHPAGIPFCKNLLAKKIVLQGDLMVAQNPESAFCYATIAVTLWNEFPDFGNLLLAHFYIKCPYLVPYYIPKTDNMTTEEHYQKLGYKYEDGQLEKPDRFLKRMTGIMRLYFSILLAHPKQYSGKNPHNIINGYTWLVSILKLEPQMDITATALHTFLETAGFRMTEVYGRTFKKLIKIINQNILPKIKKIGSEGPASRLEGLLKKYNTEGIFEKPKGLLPANFW